MTTMYSLRLSDRQSEQLEYLTRLYDNQATAFRIAIDLLYTLRKIEDLGIYDHLDIERLRLLLHDENTIPIKHSV